MIARIQFILVGVFLFGQYFSVVFSSTPLKCPPSNSILPCTCDQERQRLTCEGRYVTQLEVNKAFKIIRESNNATRTQQLRLHTFNLFSSDMTEFDLTPLFDFSFHIVQIMFNRNLWRVFGPLSQVDPNLRSDADKCFRRIAVHSLSLVISAITDEGLDDTFSYFSSELAYLLLQQNRIQGSWINVTEGNGDVEIIRGLSSLPNLVYLDLASNRITRLYGGQFKRLTKLTELSLGNNPLVEVGEDAILINPQEDIPTWRKIVFFSRSNMTDENFHHNSGLDSLQNGWTLQFAFNEFEYISSNNFKSFIQAHSKNVLEFGDYMGENANKFICDQRMKWLKDAAVADPSIENRVTGVFCRNDPGKTIFTTDLV